MCLFWSDLQCFRCERVYSALWCKKPAQFYSDRLRKTTKQQQSNISRFSTFGGFEEKRKRQKYQKISSEYTKWVLQDLRMDLPRPISSSRPSGNVVTLNRAKVTYLKYAESKERYVGARFIIECGKKLELDSVIVCTGCLLFHQFYANATKDTEHAYDQYVSKRIHKMFDKVNNDQLLPQSQLVAASCIYLSSKLDPNANQLKLRDLINVVYTTLHRKGSGEPEEPLKLEGQYYSIREAICHGELLVLRMCNFQVRSHLKTFIP